MASQLTAVTQDITNNITNNTFIAETVQEFMDGYLRVYGIARNNRFQIDITLPKVMSNSTASLPKVDIDNKVVVGNDINNRKPKNIDKIMSYYASTIEIPGIEFDTALMKVGQNRSIVFEWDQSNMTIMFIDTQERHVKRFFENWFRKIMLSDSTIEYYENYVCPKLVINTLDTNNNVIYYVCFSEAYPIAFSSENHDRQSMNNIITFQVTFEFRKMYETDEDWTRENEGVHWSKLPKVPTTNIIYTDESKWHTPQVGQRIIDLPVNINKVPAISPPTDLIGEIVQWYKLYQRIMLEINNNNIPPLMALKLLSGLARDFRNEIGLSGLSGDGVTSLINLIEEAIVVYTARTQ